VEPEAVAPVVNPAAAPEQPMAASPSVRPAEAAPASTEAVPVEITVRTIPPNASIRIDDGPPLPAPYTTKVASSDQPRVIRASAPNHVSITRQVAFDQTQEIVLELSQIQMQRRPRPRAKPDPTPTSPAPAVEFAPVQAREPGVPPSKRPRALDENNPFAG